VQKRPTPSPEHHEPSCSFCGNSHRTLVQSSSDAQVSICSECISICLSHIRDGDRESFDRIIASAHTDTRMVAIPEADHRRWQQEFRCSFCGNVRKSKVIAGPPRPQIIICYECVGLSLHDIRDKDRELFNRLISGPFCDPS
jgi:transcription elongation factor Elf1